MFQPTNQTNHSRHSFADDMPLHGILTSDIIRPSRAAYYDLRPREAGGRPGLNAPHYNIVYVCAIQSKPMQQVSHLLNSRMIMPTVIFNVNHTTRDNFHTPRRIGISPTNQ